MFYQYNFSINPKIILQHDKKITIHLGPDGNDVVRRCGICPIGDDIL